MVPPGERAEPDRVDPHENGFSIDTPRGTQLIAAPAAKEIHCAVPAELCDPFGLSENDAGVSDIQDPHRNLAGWA
jgi:hypothetical protein